MGELIPVSDRAAIVRLEDQPALSSRDCSPVVPVRLEEIAVRVVGPAVNQGEHPQVLCTELARRVNQHSLHFDAVISGPAVGFAVWQSTFGQVLVE